MTLKMFGTSNALTNTKGNQVMKIQMLLFQLTLTPKLIKNYPLMMSRRSWTTESIQDTSASHARALIALTVRMSTGSLLNLKIRRRIP